MSYVFYLCCVFCVSSCVRRSALKVSPTYLSTFVTLGCCYSFKQALVQSICIHSSGLNCLFLSCVISKIYSHPAICVINFLPVVIADVAPTVSYGLFKCATDSCLAWLSSAECSCVSHHFSCSIQGSNYYDTGSSARMRLFMFMHKYEYKVLVIGVHGRLMIFVMTCTNVLPTAEMWRQKSDMVENKQLK